MSVFKRVGFLCCIAFGAAMSSLAFIGRQEWYLLASAALLLNVVALFFAWRTIPERHRLSRDTGGSA